MRTSESIFPPEGPRVSLGIFAWNEESALPRTLDSLFEQTLFAELRRANSFCELMVVANGCTDGTAKAAEKDFAQRQQSHPEASGFVTRVADLQQRGKVNAWNQFVGALADRRAKYLMFMDADILMRQPETLWNMLQALE